MSIQNIAAISTIVVVLIGGAATAGKYYADKEYITRSEPAPYDQVYVLVSVQKLQLLYAAEDELAQLEVKKNPSTSDIARMATLRERIRNLKGE